MKTGYIYEYRFVIAVLAIIVGFSVARTVSGNHFRNGAERNAAPAFDGTNLVTMEEMAEKKAGALIINMGMAADNEFLNDMETLNLVPGDINNRDLIRKIKRSAVPVVLVSDEPSLSAAAWMILAQKGVRDIYIMADRSDWNRFKYEFRPGESVSSPAPE